MGYIVLLVSFLFASGRRWGHITLDGTDWDSSLELTLGASTHCVHDVDMLLWLL